MFKITLNYARYIALSILGLVILTPAALTEANGNPNPGVLPPNSKLQGKTYGEWGAEWWQWAHSTGVEEIEASCEAGQSGKVWFLAGTFESGSATRECTLPAGKFLFFPIVNAVYVGTDGESEEVMRDVVNDVIDGAGGLEVTLDGIALESLEIYRADSPLFTTMGFDSTDSFDSVADGFWIMHRPLPVGEHELHIHGELPAFGFETDVTYNLTVAPGN